jgi:hypothetical protein
LVSVFLLGLLNSAELDERLPPCGRWVHAGAQIVLDVHLEMAFQFFRQLAVLLFLAE